MALKSKGKYHQGIYILKNPQKYKGDPHNVVFRSSWEKKLFIWLDENSNVLEWAAEEIIIPYISPVDSRWHRYFVDVMAKVRKANGDEVTYLIEVKPYAQTIAPEVKKRITKNYINEVCTWGVNSEKWKAAREYCRQKGWEFKILTEKELFKK